MKYFRDIMIGATVVAAVAGGSHSVFAGGKSKTTPKKSAAPKYIDPANMNTRVKPGDDFYEYANGEGIKKIVIPATRSSWGSFDVIDEANKNHLHEILESVSKTQAAPGSRERNVGDFYKSGMNATAINKEGIKPVQYILDRIDQIQNFSSFLSEVNREQTEGIGQLFGFGIGPDDKNVSQEICNFYQGGMGLPTKEYYTGTDARTVKIRDAYKTFIGRMLAVAGVTDPQAAKEVYDFEAALAQSALTPVEMRDPQRMYNKFSIAQLKEQYPNLDFRQILTELKVPSFAQDSVLIATTGFFKAVDDLNKGTDINTLKNYLKFHMLSSMAPFLSDEVNDLRFDFYGKTLRGTQEQDPRWKRVMRVIDGSIGDQLGQMYVARYFKPEAKTYMLDLVNNLQQTYGDRIQRLDWMSTATKAKALQKLQAFTKKIGYPDKWKQYDGLTITDNNYAQNVINASRFEYDYEINKLGKPVDRGEWGMTPPTVNAYYNPAFNEIVFPAGILQPPFFEFSADDAVNYGGIGAVIGHEMTHGFDDQGRQYDAEGNLKDWWTPEDARKFTEKAQVVINQFNQYTVLDTVHINGELTIGENLADLGGVTIAYEAFKKTKQGRSNEKIDGFTPDQRFFLSWAQIWKGKMRPEYEFQLIKMDPHSPEIWRVNGPLSNFDPFYEAFHIQPGDKLYRAPKDRAKIW